jgi:hypothetical protein
VQDDEGPSKRRKISADYFIDDRAIGCPLIIYKDKLCVNWNEITSILKNKSIL